VSAGDTTKNFIEIITYLFIFSLNDIKNTTQFKFEKCFKWITFLINYVFYSNVMTEHAYVIFDPPTY